MREQKSICKAKQLFNKAISTEKDLRGKEN